ncbi:putative membrane protein [Mesorhizobium robiniae]|uniref:Membrane protein n=1 Tax=Mesorhizobium robiniae TaxID=559315 RepID=A0ABV2GMN7_9HYPH
MFELKRLFFTIVILLPVVAIARYTLFENASEFALFAKELRRYVAPLIVASLAVWVVIIMIVNEIDHSRQKRILNIFFWSSLAVLILAIVAVFASVKLQHNPSLNETGESVVVL